MRSTSPSEPAMLGSAVATMVWSSEAMNIGIMIDGNSEKNRVRVETVPSMLLLLVDMLKNRTRKARKARALPWTR